MKEEKLEKPTLDDRMSAIESKLDRIIELMETHQVFEVKGTNVLTCMKKGKQNIQNNDGTYAIKAPKIANLTNI